MLNDMLKRYLRAYREENYTADQLELALEKVSRTISNVDSRETEGKRDTAYDDCRTDDINLQESEANSDCERVDTCGHRKDKQRWKMLTVFSLFFSIKLAGFDYHFHPDKSKQAKSDPMIICLYHFSECKTCGPSDYGHYGLERTE